jgi:spermidine synthase
VLGGGDGLAVREILKYPQIESITLVDLDPEMTRLFSTNPMLVALNQKSFLSSRVHVINADAFPRSIRTPTILISLWSISPTHELFVSKLYQRVPKAAARHLSSQGLMVVQYFPCLPATPAGALPRL